MSLASSLPLELVHAILGVDYLVTSGQPDRRFLRSCSLVCRAWSAPAQRLLFTNVVLRSERDFRSFHAALRHSTLGNAVRTLRVIFDHNQPRGLRQHHIAAAVALCPRLNSIDLSLFGNDSVGDDHNNEDSIIRNNFDSDVSRFGTSAPLTPIVRHPESSLSLVEALNNSPITSFHLSNWSSNAHSLPPLLASLPTIKLLSIAGTSPPIPATIFPGCSLNLTHLRINFQHPPSVECLKWLLDNSGDTLKALDIERLSDSDASIGLWDHLATTYGPSLRSLILPSCATPTGLKHFQRCTDLRSVAFRTPNVSSAVFTHLLTGSQQPPIEEMSICVDKSTALSPIIEFVRNKEALKSLVVCLWEDDVRQNSRLWGSLKMACAVGGVELKVVRRLSDYKALIKSDWERT